MDAEVRSTALRVRLCSVDVVLRHFAGNPSMESEGRRSDRTV